MIKQASGPLVLVSFLWVPSLVFAQPLRISGPRLPMSRLTCNAQNR
jgi:hypothetical protein